MEYPIEIENLVKDYRGGFRAVDSLTLKVPHKSFLGFLGPNGAGKTTLFRMVTGQEKPDSGTFRIGETVQLAYVDQSRNVLAPACSQY